jgi:hypothetical protein
MDKYYPIALKYGLQYKMPWETAMAQGILESASGTSRFARERNNFHGIGAFDRNPDLAIRYESPEKGWEGYYKNIKLTSVYKEHHALEHPNDPYLFLQAVTAAGYASDKNYYNKNATIIKAVEKRAELKGYRLSRNNPDSDPNISSEFPEDPSCSGDNESNSISRDAAKNGGLDQSAANQIMTKYQNLKDPSAYGLLKYPACQSAIGNCVAFVKYFLQEYTTLKIDKNNFNIGNGADVVRNLSSQYGLGTGTEPKPFAVFSVAKGVTMCGNSLCGHTGVVG